MSNAIGVHALVWAGGWSEAEARSAIERSKAAGYDLIEVLLLDPASVDVAMTRRLLADHGLGVATSLGLSTATDVSSEDPAAVAAGRDLLHRALDVAAELGSDILTGVVYGRLGKAEGRATERGRANAVAAVAGLADRAAGAGLRVGLEIVNRYESNLFNTAAGALDFIAEVGRDNVVVHLDTYHMNIEESDLLTPVLACGDRLGYVHIGENHRGYLGSGGVDFPGLFRGLHQAGYTGPITFESFSSTVLSPLLSDTLAIWRNLWTDSDDLARHARAFIDGQLRAMAAG